MGRGASWKEEGQEITEQGSRGAVFMGRGQKAKG